MAFDPRKAMLRKDERKARRRTEFEFMAMARAMKRLAAGLGLHPVPLLDRLSRGGLDAALALAAAQAGLPLPAIEPLYRRHLAEAGGDSRPRGCA